MLWDSIWSILTPLECALNTSPYAEMWAEVQQTEQQKHPFQAKF